MKLLITLSLCLFLFSCKPQENIVNPQPLPTKSPEISATEMKITVQGGKEIDTSVTSSVQNGKSIYMALFQPPIEATDGNLYMISLKMLENFYGSGRGLIQLKDVKIKEYPQGKFLCWQIENPKQNFCLSHIKVSDTDRRIAGAMFFVE